MKQTDITNYSQFITAESEDEHLLLLLEDCEVDARTHGPDKASTQHSHDETHVIFVRTGAMHWEVDGEVLEAGPGDTIVTPPGVEHKFSSSQSGLGEWAARLVDGPKPSSQRTHRRAGA